LPGDDGYQESWPGTDAALAAGGAIAFLERISPALEQVDSSSGAIGNAVNGAIADLVSIIANAPAERPTRDDSPNARA
jgi:hypothetical protein